MVSDLNKKNQEWGNGSLKSKPKKKQKEVGGPQGPEPTRYGDWEKKGRCIDFQISVVKRPESKVALLDLTITNKNRGYY